MFSSSLSFLFKGSDDEVVDCWFDSDSVVVAVVAAADTGCVCYCNNITQLALVSVVIILINALYPRPDS